jgi:hypothetical protein
MGIFPIIIVVVWVPHGIERGTSVSRSPYVNYVPEVRRGRVNVILQKLLTSCGRKDVC